MSGCLSICVQTQTLVKNLLSLARLDAGSESFKLKRIPLDDLLQTSWKSFQKAADKQNLDVRWDVEPDLVHETDPEKIQLVLGNLFENAVHYANVGGVVSVQGKQSNGTVRICITNTGSRILTADAARVFDRFWRGDPSRAKEGVHCGLGLSICKTIVEQLGGTIAASSSTGESFSIAVML